MTRPARPQAAACALSVALGLAYVGLGLAAASRAPHTLLVCVVLALAPHAGLLALGRPLPRALVGLAAGLAAVLVLLPPVLSTDVYRYVWDGRVLAHGLSPYAYAPHDPALAPLRDAHYALVNHKHLATIYPPLAQAVFALVTALGPSGPKLAAALGVFTTAAVLERAGRAGHAPPNVGRALATHPLVLLECALEGHLEGLVLLPLVLAPLALARATQRAQWAAFGHALVAVGLKLAALPLLPALARSRRGLGLALGVFAATLLTAGALSSAGRRTGEAGLVAYAQGWSGGSFGHAALDPLLDRALAPALRGGRLEGPTVDRALRAVRGTPLDPLPPDAPRDRGLHHSVLRPLVHRAAAAALLLGVFAVLAWKVRDPRRSAAHAALALALLVPRFLPWYGVPVAALALLAGTRAGLLCAALGLLGHVGDAAYQHAAVSVPTADLEALALLLVLAQVVLDARGGEGASSRTIAHGGLP